MQRPRSDGRPSESLREAPPGNGGGPEARPDPALVEIGPEERASIQVLVVDDESTLREGSASLLRAAGFPVTLSGDGEEALALVKKRRFDILLVDLYMTPVPGREIMAAALERHPDTLVIVMTGNPSVESSVQVLREGAWDYLPKPFSATHFDILMGRAAHTVVVARESQRNTRERETLGSADGFDLIGKSQAMRSVIELATKVARTDASVFVTGESGVGKELVTQFIHHNSRRSAGELVALNCAAIPESLLESEMFGHVEGAFTGATREKPGLLEAANGGTLFLDELTELPVSTQAKLLRVLQDGVVRRIGSVRTDAVVNVRFIAASNSDPKKAVEEGRLRRDLLYRLWVVPIHVPPLRERPEDVPALAEHFLRRFWSEHRERGSAPPTFSADAMESLRRAPWPGNVRELQNVVEHLVVLVPPGEEIGPGDIPFFGQAAGAGGMLPPTRPSLMDLDYHTARERVLGEFETAYLRHVVTAADGNISDAARLAGVDRTTLYRLMEKHGARDSILAEARESDSEPPAP